MDIAMKNKFNEEGKRLAKKLAQILAKPETKKSVTNTLLTNWESSVDELWPLITSLNKLDISREHDALLESLYNIMERKSVTGQFDPDEFASVSLGLIATQAYIALLNDTTRENLGAILKTPISAN